MAPQWRLSAFGWRVCSSSCVGLDRRATDRASPVFLFLPGGMSDDGEVCAAFCSMLSAERAGYALAVALVSTLGSYLVGIAELNVNVSPVPVPVYTTFRGTPPLRDR